MKLYYFILLKLYKKEKNEMKKKNKTIKHKKLSKLCKQMYEVVEKKECVRCASDLISTTFAWIFPYGMIFECSFLVFNHRIMIF